MLVNIGMPPIICLQSLTSAPAVMPGQHLSCISEEVEISWKFARENNSYAQIRDQISWSFAQLGRRLAICEGNWTT